MTAIKFSEWQAVYLQALVEPLGSAVLEQRLQVAHVAIKRRLEELRMAPDENGERRILASALRSLRYLKSEHAIHPTGRNPIQVQDHANANDQK